MASLDVPAGWAQGRGAYGGYVVGTLIREIEKVVADPARKVRSVTAELPGPVLPGAAGITVDVLRAGSSVSTVRAQLAQGGEVAAVISASPPRRTVSNRLCGRDRGGAACRDWQIRPRRNDR